MLSGVIFRYIFSQILLAINFFNSHSNIYLLRVSQNSAHAQSSTHLASLWMSATIGLSLVHTPRLKCTRLCSMGYSFDDPPERLWELAKLFHWWLLCHLEQIHIGSSQSDTRVFRKLQMQSFWGSQGCPHCDALCVAMCRVLTTRDLRQNIHVVSSDFWVS